MLQSRNLYAFVFVVSICHDEMWSMLSILRLLGGIFVSVIVSVYFYMVWSVAAAVHPVRVYIFNIFTGCVPFSSLGGLIFVTSLLCVV